MLPLAYGYIVQGDNTISVDFNVDRVEVANLDNATVKVFVKRGSDLLEKEAEVIDSAKKDCRFSLNEMDLTMTGKYSYQYTVTFPDNRRYSGRIDSLTISNKLTGNTEIILDGGTF